MAKIHELWTTHNWKTATEEEIIQALFNPPPFLDPRDMAEIKKYHPSAISKYKELFYSINKEPLRRTNGGYKNGIIRG